MDLEDGDDGEDYVDDGDDEITAADSDAAELTWKDLKVTSPDGKTVLLYETCGRVKGRFLAIMGPSGAGKVPPNPAPFVAHATPLLTSASYVHFILYHGIITSCRLDELDEHARAPFGQSQRQGRPNGGQPEVQQGLLEESLGLCHAGNHLLPNLAGSSEQGV